MDTTIDLRYPVGKMQYDSDFDAPKRAAAIGVIDAMPAKMADAVRGLNDRQIDTPYRDGGWTVRQVVHHVADSHLNAYIRSKLMVTEEHPPIKAYQEKLWAETIDSRTLPVDVSLTLLSSLHARWVLFLKSLQPADFARTGLHSESGPTTIDRLVQLYSWHSRHHVAHITELRKRSGW